MQSQISPAERYLEGRVVGGQSGLAKVFVTKSEWLICPDRRRQVAMPSFANVQGHSLNVNGWIALGKSSSSSQ
ncbi:hypothetical protein POX_a00793 [Penicillium oxalicum]|uniref:hypothetical protein n=1 Tax=Penicillium oxalicum TaxID=69781 RepID=UPI0020B68AA9|nr:hypothetical protein POX_a00793 [Penicillium oxalicum]KAI2794203.1 hypothetical protein POX_a00793 [Penicillium oxalicum]